MNFELHISEIRKGLQTGNFRNEAAISHGVVIRILQSLDWPVFDSTVVIPKYGSGRGRVDFALCHPANKPIIFIEVKQQGQSKGGDRQLFEYAFHEGVPLAVLTDGQEWNFYLPAEQGKYDERRVYKLDLLERGVSESVERLSRYLRFGRICSGVALEDARADYKNVAKDRDIMRALPSAWQSLLKEPDALLIDLLAEKVEDICGFKPDADTVSEFLTKRPTDGEPYPRPPVSSHIPQPTIPTPKNLGGPRPPQTTAKFGFVLLGNNCEAHSAKEVLVKTLRSLAENDKSFLRRFAARPKHGRKRRYVASSREALYPGRPDLADLSEALDGEFFVGTNFAVREIEKILRMACEVAGIEFGRDLKVRLGN